MGLHPLSITINKSNLSYTFIMEREQLKQPQTGALEQVKPKNSGQTSSTQPTAFKPMTSEQLVRAQAKFDFGTTQLNRQIEASKEPGATEDSIQAALNQTPTLDPRQTPIDPVDQIGFINQTDGAQLHAYPTGTKTNNLLKPATQVTLIGKYRYDHGWSYVRGIQDGTMIGGWLQTARVNLNLPEPRAKLHLVKNGETAERLAVQNFRDHVKPGQDLRFYENVLAYINRKDYPNTVIPAIQALGVTVSGVQLNPGLMWLVSPEFAKTLQGVVGSGSITGGAVAKARTANHAVTDTLESITLAISNASGVMSKDAWEAVSQNWRELLNGLLLFVGAEALSGALAVAPDPTMLSKIAASAIQFGLSAWGASGVVAAGGKSLEMGTAWLNTAIHANGDHKKIEKASLELIRMLEFMALAALAVFGAKGNAAKGLKIASEIKMPPLGGQGQVAMAGGGKLENPQTETPTNANAAGKTEVQKPLAGVYKESVVEAALKKLPHLDLFAPGALEHLIFGEVRGTRMTGWHLYGARRPGLQVRIVNFFKEADARGVYQAEVEGSIDGGKTWNLKTAKNHTFFPNNWSQAQLVDEIANAFKENRDYPKPDHLAQFDWVGRSKSGIRIVGYLDAAGKIKTAFPIYGE